MATPAGNTTLSTGLAGVARLAGLDSLPAAGFDAGVTRATAIAAKTQELAWLNQQPKTKPLPQAPLLNDEQALRKFYRQFPLADELSPQLAELHQLALEQGIVLTAGEYKLSNDANDPNLLRYEIIFPLHSSYKNLKSFIAAAGLKFPTLVLSEINIKRESISDNSAQIKLNFVWLLVRSH